MNKHPSSSAAVLALLAATVFASLPAEQVPSRRNVEAMPAPSASWSEDIASWLAGKPAVGELACFVALFDDESHACDHDLSLRLLKTSTSPSFDSDSAYFSFLKESMDQQVTRLHQSSMRRLSEHFGQEVTAISPSLAEKYLRESGENAVHLGPLSKAEHFIANGSIVTRGTKQISATISVTFLGRRGAVYIIKGEGCTSDFSLLEAASKRWMDELIATGL